MKDLKEFSKFNEGIFKEMTLLLNLGNFRYVECFLVIINEEHIFRCVLILLHFFFYWSFWIVMCLPVPFITKINKNTQACTSLGSIDY